MIEPQYPTSPLDTTLLPDNSKVVDGRLQIGGCEVADLVEEYETPLFIYDEEHLRERCRLAQEVFNGTAAYASKAFLCVEMARLIQQSGLWLDVSTGGEMAVAQAAGFPPSRMVMHGNAKSERELSYALSEGAGRIVVDSFDELDKIDGLVDSGYPVPQVLIRITPGVDAHTHEFVRTGHDDTKFGFPVSAGAAERAIDRVRNSESVRFRGIHAHIGSQVFRLDSLVEAARVVSRFALPYQPPELSLGGGLGVAYISGEHAPSITDWAEAIIGTCREEGIEGAIWAEPGRAIVASAAITVYRVMAVKTIPGVRTYVAVDGGMSDNPRPVLYGSGYETFDPLRVDHTRERSVRVVGKHCESGDVLVEQGWLPAEVKAGQLLATPVTGAYGHSMGSNYNKVLRPPVIFCRNGTAREVVRRETYGDLLRLDTTI